MQKFNLGRVRGEDGKSATIAIGTVRTGQAGSDASVENVGDSLHAIFDFTIPRGNEAYSAGSNVQISGGVISATDTTYAPATSSADGLMSKEDKVRLDGTVNDADPRLIDAREWTATTVSQAEAEAGTASTRRAWTAQRVRQAIAAWYSTVSTSFTRTLLGRSTAEQVRGDLGLGTAAMRADDYFATAEQVGDISAALDAINGEVI